MTTRRKKRVNKERVIQRLRTLQERMLTLLDEADDLIRTTASARTYLDAKSYWMAHARIALTEDHEYMTDDANMDKTLRIMEKEDVIS